MANRRTLDQTRLALLEAGTRMLVDDGITVSLANVSLIDVCREAGLSTAGSGYKIWPTQDAYRADLLDHLLTLTTIDPATISRLTEVARASRDHVPQLRDLIRTIAPHPGEWAAGGPGYAVFTTLLLAARHDPHLLERLRDSDQTIFAHLAELYEATADAYGLEWVEPFDADRLALTLSAVSEGISVRARTLPEILDVHWPDPNVDGDDATPWTLHSACVMAIIEAFTRPAVPDDAHPAHASDAVRDPQREPKVTGDAEPDTGPEIRPGRRRRPLAETRTLLLDTGARMVIDSDTEVTIGRLDLVDVCRAAGMKSAGSAYKIWDSQESFRIDLIRHLFTTKLENDRTPEELLGMIASAGETLPPFTEMIRVASQANFVLNSGTQNSVSLAVGLAAAHDRSLAAALHDFETASLDAFTALYDQMAIAYERQWVAPFDARTLALALSALVQGFAIREMVTPERVETDLCRPTGPDGAARPWHLFACAAEALVMAFTRPVRNRPEDRGRPRT